MLIQSSKSCDGAFFMSKYYRKWENPPNKKREIKNHFKIMSSCCMIMVFLIIENTNMNLSLQKFEDECGIWNLTY